MSETNVNIDATVPAPVSLLKRIPVKKAAIATLVVAAVVVAVKYVKENSDVDVNVDTTTD